MRDPHRLSAQVPRGRGDRQGDLRGGAGRGRDCRAGDGAGGSLGRSPVDDRDVRARRLAHGRVRRPRLLRGGARGHLRHPAGGALDGVADPHRPGRRPVDRVPLSRGHAASVAVSLLPGRVLLDGDGRLRPRRAVPDAVFVGDLSRHEHVDVAEVRVPVEAAGPRQGAGRGDPGEDRAVRPLRESRYGIPYRSVPGTSAPAYFCRGSGHTVAAHVPAPRPNRRDKSTSTTRAQVRDPPTGCRRRRSRRPPRDHRHHRLRHEPLGGGGRARPAPRGSGPADVLLPAPRLSVPLGPGVVHRAARARLRGRAEPGRAAGVAHAARAQGRAGGTAPQRAALRGRAHRRPQHHRRHPDSGRVPRGVLRGRRPDSARGRRRRR